MQPNMPRNHRLIFMTAERANIIAAINEERARAIKEAIDALAPYLR